MNTFIEAFLLGLTLHAGLLLNAIYQNAFILSRGLGGRPVFNIVLIFSISSFITATFGIYILDSIGTINETFEIVIGSIGATVLFYQAIKAFKYARSHHDYPTKNGGIFVALAMVWLTPHIYTDMFLISSIAIRLPNEQHFALVLGFATMATAWFSTLAYFSSRLSKIYANHKIHTAMHYISAFILGTLSLSIIISIIFGLEHSH